MSCIKPSGWLRKEMERDLNGFVGNLDEAVPEILLEDDIFGANRLSKDIKKKDVGSLNEGWDWEIQYLWWGAEQLGNWLDGLVRYAFLLDDEGAKKKAKFYLDRAFRAQDEDGYIGIYAPDLRFNFNGENGELWAQTTLFRAALAFDEMSNTKTYLDRILRAVDCTMKAYPCWKSEPYRTTGDYSGLTHGLMFTDIMYELYLQTGDGRYLEYAAFLYEDYCSHPVHEQDIARRHLSDRNWMMRDHGAHVYEQIRAVITASLAKKADYEALVSAFFAKLPYLTQPSGGPIGDECIGQRCAAAERTGYEYCSIQELCHSYGMMLETTGDSEWADKLEHLVWNAGFASRHPFRSQISYLNCDNSYRMMGDGMKSSGIGVNARYKYSVAHKDAAVCCVPNAGRLLPYYLREMYFPRNDGIEIALFGPSVLETKVAGNAVRIEQRTNFPFENSVQILAESAVTIRLAIRLPAWAESFTLDGAKYMTVGSYVEVQCAGKTEFMLSFSTKPQRHIDLMGDEYFTVGCLTYAYPIQSMEHFGITYREKFHDTRYEAVSDEYRFLRSLADTAETVKLVRAGKNVQNPPVYAFRLLDAAQKVIREVEMIPIGCTLLRRTTFPVGDERVD